MTIPEAMHDQIAALVNHKMQEARDAVAQEAQEAIATLQEQHRSELAARDEALGSLRTQLESATIRVDEAQDVLAGGSDRASLMTVDNTAQDSAMLPASKVTRSKTIKMAKAKTSVLSCVLCLRFTSGLFLLCSQVIH